MPVKLSPGAGLPCIRFDAVLNVAHAKKRRELLPSDLDEPAFVRALVSDWTINALNKAAAEVYDPLENIVYFRGGFLHGYPYATFTATHPSGTTPPGLACSRELADALLVVYITRPDATGHHQIEERRACFLMFKCKDARKPRTPNFQPGVSILPPRGNSDKEQFYLFNKWPAFTLNNASGQLSPALGQTYDLRHPTGAYPHDIGKYALIWKGGGRLPWKYNASNGATTQPGQARWLYANPVHKNPIFKAANPAASVSLGSLLEQIIDQMGGQGRSFDPWAAPAPSPGWDELMQYLLGFPTPAAPSAPFNNGLLATLSKGKAAGKSKDINPGIMHFVDAFGPVHERHVLQTGSVAQDFRNGVLHPPERVVLPDMAWLASFLPDLGIRPRPRFPFLREAPDPDKDSIPVLIATVHHFTPLEERSERPVAG